MARQEICLNMIVKNEAAIIERCLASVLKWITCYCIVDTGSTDDTVAVIERFFKQHGVRGQVHQRPWVDFEHNRNEALELSRTLGDDSLYNLCMDADEEFKPDKDFKLPSPLTASQYTCDIQHGCRFARTRLYRAQLYEWWYPTHEALCPINPFRETIVHLKGCYVDSHTDGARAKDPERWRADARSLDNAIELRERGELWRGKPLQLSRLYFYSGNSYFHAKDYELAMDRYHKRIAIDEFAEEVFQAYYMLAKCKQALQRSREEVVGAYLEAWCVRPTRFEPIYHILNYLMSRGDFTQAQLFAERMLAAKIPDDRLFVEEWAYHEGKRLAGMLLQPTASQAIELATRQYLSKQWVAVLHTLDQVKLKELTPAEKFSYYDLRFIANSWLGRVEAELEALRKIFEMPVKRWKTSVGRIVGWAVSKRGIQLSELREEVRAEYLLQQSSEA